MVDVAYLYATILVNSEHLESAGTFNTKHLGHIICIFEDNSDYQFCLWEIYKYKQVMDFIKKLSVCDMDVVKTKNFVTYNPCVQ